MNAVLDGKANWYVEVVDSKTDEVVESMGPHQKWKADKIDNGVNINLNHEAYFTRVVQK